MFFLLFFSLIIPQIVFCCISIQQTNSLTDIGNVDLLADNINADGNVTLNSSIDNYRYIYAVGKSDGMHGFMPISVFKSVGKLTFVLDGLTTASQRPKSLLLTYIDTTHINVAIQVVAGYYESFAIYGIK